MGFDDTFVVADDLAQLPSLVRPADPLADDRVTALFAAAAESTDDLADQAIAVVCALRLNLSADDLRRRAPEMVALRSFGEALSPTPGVE